MTRTQFQTYLVNNINRAMTVAAASGLLVLLACSSSGRAASEHSKSTPVSMSQPMQAQPVAAKLETVSEKSASPVVHRASVGTLRNDDFGISLEYPWQYGFKSGHKLRLNGEEVETGFVAPGGINLGVIEIPAGYYEKTDFERAFLSANVNRKLTSEQCSQFADMSDRDPRESKATTEVGKTGDSASDASSMAKPAIATKKVKVGDQEYLMIEQQSDDSTLRTYHAYQSGVCYEFVLGLKTNDSDGSENVNDQIKPVSQKQVFARLEKILATVDITPDADQNGSAVAATTAPSDVPPQKP